MSDSIGAGTVHITGPDVNHIAHVLRMKAGERLCVVGSDGAGALCEIVSIGKDEVRLSPVEPMAQETELPARITLFQGLPKGDKLEWIVEKAVELGVCEVVPVQCARSVAKWVDPGKLGQKLRRYNQIALSAAKQCGRALVPVVRPPMTWKEALGYAQSQQMDLCLIPYENEGDMDATKRALDQVDRDGRMHIGVFIGPEGGFAPEEVQGALDAGMRTISLGRRILRTETAAVAALAILMMRLEMHGSVP
ncbi:MAG: 16S rRNA (uracil(1498)-N(3))-methyltransferase [Lachnospiraceae bacterium]|nr:16S rRNA (uracil(1498)-N(3))-methyltransferase [Lachnospiraceae bacterium]